MDKVTSARKQTCVPISQPTSTLEGCPHVAILFHRLGPYHHARLKAAGARLRVTAVEFSNVDPTYAWDLVAGADGFDRRTLFSGVYFNELPAGRILKRVSEVLDQLHPHVVAIPGWYDRCSLAALHWCGVRRIPVVVMSESTAWDAERKWWKEWTKKRLLRSCSAGMVGGSAHGNYLAQLGIDRGGIFFGYDAVDNEYFAHRANEVRKHKDEHRRKLGLPENFFLASARFVKKKNLASLIKAYATYRKTSDLRPPTSVPWDLVLLGDGQLRPDLCHLISELGLQNVVHLPGFKQYDELPIYYGLANAFIHASITEQWGLVVNEAMASGLPVLVSNRCGCAADLVREGCNGFTFDPYNGEELARLMTKLSAGDLNLEQMGQKSRDIIETCSPATFAKNMEAACKYSLANHRVRKHTVVALPNLLIYLPKSIYKRTLETIDAQGHLNPAASGTRTVPNFFIIGAPKSGTTSLSEYLKDHPNIFFSAVKEPHFFDRDASKRLKLKPQTYLSLFSGADPNLHKAVGEGSTGYLISKVAVSEILKISPDAKFIVMLRNPVDLVQSWHSEMYFEGVENVREFEKAWRLEEGRRNGRNIPYSCWEPKKLFYSDWGKLGDQVERLFSVASRDKVKVILFDDFVADSAGVYGEVLSFLGVPSDGRTNFPAVNENKALRQVWLQRSLAISANYFRMIRARSGFKLSLGVGLSQKLMFLNSKPAARKPSSPAMRAELTDYYQQDIQKLSALIGRDLSAWLLESRSRREHVLTCKE